ncbi:MAG: TIGR01777 family protein [Anaerolineae bacterium]|nr:TIGR01777 family protein [Anaerolineae bacterium]
MANSIFETSVEVSAPVQALFDYHERPGAFLRINPPWEPVEVVEHTGGIRDGARVDIRLNIGPVPVRWLLTHQNYQHGVQFEDQQVRGPFAFWRHTHRTEPLDDTHSRLIDHIEYRLPMGVLGKTFGGAFARAKLRRMFTYRHAVTLHDLHTQRRYPQTPLRIAITGASGLIGTQLAAFLSISGHEVLRLVRGVSNPARGKSPWNPTQGRLDPAQLEGLDAVIHLAGEDIAGQRWTPAQKQRILESRSQGTRLLAETLAQLQQPPHVLLSASAVGYYGDRDAEILTEDSPPGDLFVSEVVRAWEDATQPARDAGIRVVNLRMGTVLALQGGALARMLLPFQLGTGGTLGNGRQWMSWISLDDVLGAFYHALMTEALSGPVNVVAPAPVTNQEYTRTLGRVLARPTLIPIPPLALRVLYGELANELLFASTRALPHHLEATGYQFRHRELEPALRHVLGRVK